MKTTFAKNLSGKKFLSRQTASLVLFALFLFGASAVRAATYTVTTTDDSGAGSLREALTQANFTTDEDTIVFSIPSSDANCTSGVCTIKLVVELTIVDVATGGNLTIDGTNASSLIISGNSVTRVFRVSPGANVNLKNITVSDGKTFVMSGDPTFQQGGGIYNEGTLVLTNAVVSNNNPHGNGGGIYSNGTLTLNNSSVNSNHVIDSSGNDGGGIFSSNGSTTLNNSIVSYNVARRNAAGISCSGCSLTVTNSVISNNLSQVGGGAGINGFGDTTIITNSTISDNTAYSDASNTIGIGGGLIVGFLTMVNSTVSNNIGGGVYIKQSSSIANSTISGNTGRNFGGIYDSSQNLTLTNVTITNNSASRNFPAFGAGGGITNFSANISMRNTIVAGNTSVTTTPDLFAYDSTSNYISNGNDLIGDATHTGASITWQGSDILNQPANLAALGNYGGTTMTHALLSNSMAINNGNNCVLMANGCGDNNPALATDERGEGRVGNVDIGAFELTDVTLHFNNVSQGGNTTATPISPAAPAPQGYTFPQNAPAYEISTTATYSGTIDVTLQVPNISSATACDNLRILHYTGGAWSDAGNAAPQYDSNTMVCTLKQTVSSLSPFAVAKINSPTAAGASLSGRVMNGRRGIRGALVTLTEADGATHTVSTGMSGNFRFDDIAAGQTVIVSVRAKRFTFSPQILTISEDLIGVNFYAAANFLQSNLGR